MRSLSAIQTELLTLTLTTALNVIKSEVDSLKTAIKSNSSTLDKHDQALQSMEFKVADMEVTNRRCNICVIGLDERLVGCNATQFISLSHFPPLTAPD